MAHFIFFVFKKQKVSSKDYNKFSANKWILVSMILNFVMISGLKEYFLKNVPKKAIPKNCFYEVITVPDRDPGNCTDPEISGTSLRGCGGETMQAKPDPAPPHCPKGIPVFLINIIILCIIFKIKVYWR